MLTAHHPELWTARGELRLLGVDAGGRMTVVRLGKGGLVVVSPIRSVAEEGVEELGPVTAIVAPNRFHHLFVARAQRTFPDARTFVAPGLPEKRPDLPFDEVLGDEPPAPWRGELDQAVLRAAPMLNEVVLFHRASRTLIATDLAFNIQRQPDAWGRWMCRAYGVWRRFGPSRLVRLAIRDRAAARRTVDALLSWQPDRVVVAHGDILETGGEDALRRAFAWL